jgi:hypothetical protein
MKRNQRKRQELASEIASAINRCSAENVSNTPDFILAEYLVSCLESFEKLAESRGTWHGRRLLASPKTPRSVSKEKTGPAPYDDLPGAPFGDPSKFKAKRAARPPRRSRPSA